MKNDYGIMFFIRALNIEFGIRLGSEYGFNINASDFVVLHNCAVQQIVSSVEINHVIGIECVWSTCMFLFFDCVCERRSRFFCW